MNLERWPTRPPVLTNQHGLTMMTVLLTMVAMTILGLVALTVSGVGTRLAGWGATGESAAAVAEACVGTAVRLIQETQDFATIPLAYLDNATPPGPVPQGNAIDLTEELMGNRVVANSPDRPDGPGAAPNIQMTVNAFTVVGDIDYLYVQPRPGHNIGFPEMEKAVDLLYRIECVATNAAAQTSSRIVAVYACMLNGSCQRT